MSMIKKYLNEDIYIYLSPEERRKIIDDLRLCNSIMMEYQKIINFFRK